MMKIDTGAIRSTALAIAAQNERLEETLLNCQQAVHSLSGDWTGAAAEAAIAAFDSFAAKYFAQYREMLDEYVKFLNDVAGEGYEEAERQAVRKADLI